MKFAIEHSQVEHGQEYLGHMYHQMYQYATTVYPNNYVHGSCFVVFYCALLIVNFMHIINIYFTCNNLQIA